MMKDLYFEVQVKSGIRSDSLSSVKKPSKYPCFVLNHNDNWNDYGCYTWYSLFYFKSSTDNMFIGELKIMNKNNSNTNKVIAKSFSSLSSDYCSLGISNSYYNRLKCKFSVNECEQILVALQDCAVQIEQYEKFKDDSTFQESLIRDLSSEKARREAKYIIHDMSLSDAYNIQYLFHPEYNTKISIPFKLKFSPKARLYDRCAGIIGENGVGKTTMLGGMIDCLVNHKQKDLLHELPLFSSVMSVCTTPFDCFSDIKQENNIASLIPYYYFCANQDKDKAFLKIKESVYEIRKRKFEDTELFDFYDRLLKKELQETAQYDWWYYEEDGEDKKFKIDDKLLKTMLKNLSPGQLQLLLLITFIFRKINFDTLIVIDEPEVHLHPKAINVLFKLLLFLLDKFQSYCIVSTHSPLIVRELAGKNVYMMRRFGNELELGKIGIETLGEDISTLYDEIFGYDENTTSLAKNIRQLKKSGKTYKDIICIIKNDSHRISLSTRILIKQIVDYEKS